MLTRQFPDDFPTDEVLLLSDVSVPESGTFAPMSVKTNVSGVNLDVIGMVGEGIYSISNDVVENAGFIASPKNGTTAFAAPHNANSMSKTGTITGPALVLGAQGLSGGRSFELLVTDHYGEKVRASIEKIRGSLRRSRG